MEPFDKGVCGITTEGQLQCWGSLLRNLSREEAEPFSHDGPFVDIAVSRHWGCGILESGELECWNFSSDEKLPGMKAPEGKFSEIAVRPAGDVACAIRQHEPTEGAGATMQVSSGGDIVCWGDDKATSDESRIVKDMSARGQRIAMAAVSACAINANENSRPKCWGWGAVKEPQPRAAFKRLWVAGAGQYCGLTFDNGVECWGQSEGVPSLLKKHDKTSIRDFSASDKTTCVISQAGDVECKGYKADIPSK